ncbi:uncharacterized protein LOC134812106 [Bolinopsis microptera]|uniref:uncharacterized protein LOC134812106 n=1 Tax=Bolinopsis microptera TaxID=2820187 RepID=UPI00307A0F0D
MSIEIHNPHLVNSLVADAERRTLRAYPSNKSGAERKRSTALDQANSHPVAVSSHQTTAETKLKTEEIEKDCFKQLLNSERLYRELTITENTFVKTLDDELEDNKRKHKQKYDVLFSKWEDSIFKTVKADVNSKLTGRPFNSLDTQKRRLYSRYLSACNTKGTVFLDVICKDEYDPLRLAKRNISTTVPSTRDPTKLVQNEDVTSASIEKDCGVKSTSTRSSTAGSDTRGSCNEWIRLPIRDVDSSVRQRTRQRMMNKSMCSRPAQNELNLPKRKHAVPSYNLHRPISQMFF